MTKETMEDFTTITLSRRLKSGVKAYCDKYGYESIAELLRDILRQKGELPSTATPTTTRAEIEDSGLLGQSAIFCHLSSLYGVGGFGI